MGVFPDSHGTTPTPTHQKRTWDQVAIPNPTFSGPGFTAWWYRIEGWVGDVNRAPSVSLEP